MIVKKTYYYYTTNNVMRDTEKEKQKNDQSYLVRDLSQELTAHIHMGEKAYACVQHRYNNNDIL